MNTHAVQVDEETLRASLESEAAIPPPPPGATPGADPAADQVATDPTAWLTEARLLASFMAHKVTPGWEVSDQVREEWAASLSECLDKLFPGGMGNVAEWGPWGKFIYLSAGWGMAGFDMEKFKFKPLHPNQQKPPIDGESTPAPGAAPMGGGKFTTSG